MLTHDDREVFGGGHRDESGRLSAGTSTMALIAAKRQERQRAKAVDTRPTPPQDNSEVEQAGPNDTTRENPGRTTGASDAGDAGSRAPTPISVSQVSSVPVATLEKSTTAPDDGGRAEDANEDSGHASG